MRHFFVTLDYNDADYTSDLVSISEEQFQRFLPLMEAINNFQPYISKHGAVYNNWDSCRQDLYEMKAEQIYKDFDPALIQEFREIFCSITNPEEAYNGGCFHTIVNIQEVTLGKRFVRGEYEAVKNRNKETIDEYNKRWQELYGFDGPRNLYTMQPKYMTEEEKARCLKARNLWKEYRPDLNEETEEKDY